MVRILAALALVAVMVAVGASAVHAQQPQTQPQAQNEFVPVKDLPSQDQLPAAPLVAVAYAFVWVVLVVYVWSISRRVGKVQSELTELRNRTARRA